MVILTNKSDTRTIIPSCSVRLLVYGRRAAADSLL